MSLYEQISIIILIGCFLMLVQDHIESRKKDKFYKQGYLDEKQSRKEYRVEKLKKLNDLPKMIWTYNDLKFNALIDWINRNLITKLDKIYKESNKDAGAIKRRLKWSGKRERKDLKAETRTPYDISPRASKTLKNIVKAGRETAYSVGTIVKKVRK